MRYREFHYRWEFDLDASPQALWPLVADTNRFNRDAGLPSLEFMPAVADEAEANGSRRGRRLRISKLGLGVNWEEEPFEWIQPVRFGVVRRYTSGPLAEMRVRVELREREGGGTRLSYEVWARPRSPLGLVAIPLQIGQLSARKFAQVFRRYDRLAQRDDAPLRFSDSSRLSAGARARLDKIREELVAQGASPELAARLVETVERSDDLTLARIRPYTLANYWNAPRRDVLELCLRATRAGLLDFRWDLLCPLCRGAKASSESLKDLKLSVHCDACRIDVSADFDRSVEVTFRPNAAVREVRAQEFCVGGPRVTPHVVAQQLVGAGASRTINPALEEGSYRLRAAGAPGAQLFFVAAEGESAAGVRVGRAGVEGGDEELRLAPGASLEIENASAREQLLIFERTAWNDEAATAADVTALQTFRDLFAREALRPGDQISVGSLTLAFTDLRNSTRLYREIGDAVAFGAVMNHFDVLRECIAEEGGAIVKTIGDAVMAVFRQPSDALRAMLRAQQALASPPAGARPLLLKVGIHSGPCIAVTLNERLDYFGSHVNIAARLEPLSTGEDIVMSSPVRDDPQVAAILADPDQRLLASPVEAALKGFDAESFSLWRITMKAKGKR